MATRRKIVARLTQEEAERLGIVFCECDHPPNNHFYKNHVGGVLGGCAFCACKKYKQCIHVPGRKP